MRVAKVPKELTDLQESERQMPGGYPRHRFVLLLVILVLLVATIGLAQRFAASVKGPAISEATIEGDFAMKLSYAYRRWTSSGSVETDRKQRVEDFEDVQRQLAVSLYRRAVRDNPSPGNVRRLIIVEDPSDRRQAIEELSKAVSESRAGGFGDARLPSELVMWRDVYLGADELTHEEASDYERRIRVLELGWYEHLALADLFERTGSAVRADEERDAAARAAGRTIGQIAAVLTVLILLGMTGAVLIVWYVAGKIRGQPDGRNEVSELSPYDRDLVAGCLLEVFLVYLGIVLGTQMAAGTVLGLGAVGEVELGRTDTAFVTTGVYVLAGVLSVVYLAFRLRGAGWRWQIVGLITKDPVRDVIWGIGGYAAALPLLAIAGVFSQILGRYVQTPPNPIVSLFTETETLFGRLVLLGLVVVAAPFFEELFFRGVLYGSFRKRWGVSAGIVLSAVVFAAVHPLPVGFLPIFVLGCVFAILLRERGSLLPAVVAHGMNNAVAFALLLILMR